MIPLLSKRWSRFGTAAPARYVAALAIVALIASGGAHAGEPWRLSSAAALPDWLHVSGSHRTRYETLDGQFRSGRDGGDQMIALRTIVLTELRLPMFRVGIEAIDSRAMLDDGGSPLNTTMINPVELLQGYVAIDTSALDATSAASELRLGRLTLDVGSRRLVARSLYRNTINTFTGGEWRWKGVAGNQLQVFYTLPVNRKPNTAGALGDNTIEFDEEDTEVRFWGVYYGFGALPGGHRAELYILGLDENDAGERRTSNRELYTPGLRFYRPKMRGRLDYLFESVLQFGESRASTAPGDERDLDHIAHFQHGEIGYTLVHPWAPHLNVEFDYASGDDDPTDGDNERFDTLFGARRFDFGPTGIYGPFARSNLLSPGLRLDMKPHNDISLMMAYRGFWLASDTDAWTTSGVRDTTGDSGSFIGQQIEFRFRWEVVPGNYRFEAGTARLFDGEFMREAANSPRQGDAWYGYTQVVLSF